MFQFGLQIFGRSFYALHLLYQPISQPNQKLGWNAETWSYVNNFWQEFVLFRWRILKNDVLWNASYRPAGPFQYQSEAFNWRATAIELLRIQLHCIPLYCRWAIFVWFAFGLQFGKRRCLSAISMLLLFCVCVVDHFSLLQKKKCLCYWKPTGHTTRICIHGRMKVQPLKRAVIVRALSNSVYWMESSLKPPNT